MQHAFIADSEPNVDASANSNAFPVQQSTSQNLEGTSYRLNALLGTGSMGEVYLGEHEGLRRPAVIKIIRGHYARDPKIVGRMIREARIVANLQHKALVHIYDLGTSTDGRTFIAMEHLDGEILRLLLHHRGALPIEMACSLMIQALEGLAAAHAVGVIHRDIKPENLFVTASGQLKVLDFGVAKIPIEETSGAYTAAGMIVGTPRYMAPEQARGYVLSCATDLYAIGCVLFECLTGSAVFEATDAQEYLRQHLFVQPPTLTQRTGRKFDEELEAIVAQALRKNPNERFSNAQAMIQALQHVAHRLNFPKRNVPMGTVFKANIGKEAYLTKQNLGFLKTTMRTNFDAMTVSSQLGATATSLGVAQHSSLAFQATEPAHTNHTQLVQTAWLIRENAPMNQTQKIVNECTHVKFNPKDTIKINSSVDPKTPLKQRQTRTRLHRISIIVGALLLSGILFSYASHKRNRLSKPEIVQSTATFESLQTNDTFPSQEESFTFFSQSDELFPNVRSYKPSLSNPSASTISTPIQKQPQTSVEALPKKQKSTSKLVTKSAIAASATPIASTTIQPSVASSSSTPMRTQVEATTQPKKRKKTVSWVRE